MADRENGSDVAGESSNESEKIDMNNLKIEGEEGTVDKPDIVLKPDKLQDEPETEIKKVVEGPTLYKSAKTFEELQISDLLLKGLYSEMKFEKPSKIQAETLPMILNPPYANLIAQAHNGSGKTTCFVLGMLSRVDPTLRTPQALCICPTRELAQQNEQVARKMGKYSGVTVACTANPFSTLQTPIVDQLVIGTPGTIKRWITKDKILAISNIRILVFDEADHMLAQDGFQDDSMRIINLIERKVQGRCQILLFSATWDPKVTSFAMQHVPNANKVLLPPVQLSLDVIKQFQVKVPRPEARVEVLQERIFPAAEKLGQTIIFVRTREMARDLHRKLEKASYKCTSIHGGMDHEVRDAVIKEFREGTTKILISTDVLARGFDQAQVTLVVNYDLPVKFNDPRSPEFETYLHRIGRSGRFGRKGAAFNMVVNRNDDDIISKIEKHFNKKITPVRWDDDNEFETVLKEAGLA